MGAEKVLCLTVTCSTLGRCPDLGGHHARLDLNYQHSGRRDGLRVDGLRSTVMGVEEADARLAI